jgi:2-keto-4-pentenoate hydratase/2-oxohepta-3-ene-1,7-dioic acid hydratase in catechol pathway
MELATASASGQFRGLHGGDAGFPGSLGWLIAEGSGRLRAAGERLAQGRPIDPGRGQWPPPLPAPGKIICVGLNYVDHSLECGFVPPAYPTIFARFFSSMICHRAQTAAFHEAWRCLCGRNRRHRRLAQSGGR